MYSRLGPCARLYSTALAVLPLRVLCLRCLRCRPEALKRRHRSAERERSTTTNGLIFRASAFVPHDGDGDGPQLEHKPAFCRHASSGYAGLIRVLIISCALSLRTDLTLNLKGFRHRGTMQHGEGVWSQIPEAMRCARLALLLRKQQTRGRSMLPFAADGGAAMPLGFPVDEDTEVYIVRLIGWARKYRILVNLDLHTAPGSRNGYNHSGDRSTSMGYTKGRCMLDYIRRSVESIFLHQYKDLIPMFCIVNEAYLPVIGRDVLTSLYARNMIRGITGYGADNGPFIGIDDGFRGTAWWTGFLPGSANRIILDTDPYFAQDMAEAGVHLAGTLVEYEVCSRFCLFGGEKWQGRMCRSAFRVTLAAYFSNGYNDYELYLTGVNGTQHYGGDSSL
ncbi:glycoside hydrolase superfamily [Mycena galopus ATCC 62051]|nr:glycoside hydrolase superfamily [Mycena galopus ATCC 62051]